MITIADLKSSLYDQRLFSEYPSSIRVNNMEEGVDNKVEYVTLTSEGTFINIDNNILKKSKEIYSINDGNVSFRKDCDGICLLHRGERKFIIFTEVKSGFANMEKKAYFQLITSYVRCKSFLSTLDVYSPSEYEEVAIAISYPIVQQQISNNDQHQESRQSVINKYAPLRNRYRRQILDKSYVDMSMSDFEIDKLHLKSGLINDHLHLIHIPIQSDIKSASINLDEILL